MAKRIRAELLLQNVCTQPIEVKESSRMVPEQCSSGKLLRLAVQLAARSSKALGPSLQYHDSAIKVRLVVQT